MLLADELIGPEHLFLALLWPEASVGPTITRAYGVTLDRARVAMHEMAAWGLVPAAGRLPMAVSAERAIEIADRRAGDGRIEHADMLVGVLSVRSVVIAKLLAKLRVSPSDLLNAAATSLPARPSTAASAPPSWLGRRTAELPPSSSSSPPVRANHLSERVESLSLRVEELVKAVERLLAAQP